jgi:hypothetical protein
MPLPKELRQRRRPLARYGKNELSNNGNVRKASWGKSEAI